MAAITDMTVRDVKLKEFMDEYHRPLREDLYELRLSNEEAGVPLILRETEAALSLLLDFTHPQNILELGTAHGYSALFFAAKCPDAAVTTIDRNPGMIDFAKASFERFKEGNRIRFITADALETLEKLEAEVDSGADRYDFIFIDAGKSHYREFLDVCERICTDDAVIVCDNILMKGWLFDYEGKSAKRHRTNIKYMKQFLDYINGRDDLDVTILSGGDGLAVIRPNHDR
jgi:predicted O-methyltransferase YrrM